MPSGWWDMSHTVDYLHSRGPCHPNAERWATGSEGRDFLVLLHLKLQDKFQEAILSFHCVSFGDQHDFSGWVTSAFTRRVTLLSPDGFILRILISLVHATASLVPFLNICNTNYPWSCDDFFLLWELITCSPYYLLPTATMARSCR